MKRIALKAILMQLKKNTKPGKAIIKKYSYLIFLLIIFSTKSIASELNFADIKILDKVSSKTSQLSLNIEQETKFENLIIKILKCKNSEFDDNPEITAYIQVKDLTDENNNEVFVFNGWMFSSSPSITPFDHAVYDIWLVNCY